MARRTEGQRVQPANAAILAAQARGESNAAAELRRYRAAGNTIRTQDWYRIWRGSRDLPTPPEPQRRFAPDVTGGRVAGATGYITNVGVTYLDPRDGSYVTHWHQVHTRRPITDDQAEQEAIDQGDPTGDRYGWQAVLVFVTSREAKGV